MSRTFRLRERAAAFAPGRAHHALLIRGCSGGYRALAMFLRRSTTSIVVPTLHLRFRCEQNAGALVGSALS